jgi:tartrate-resistant acid phosphatase type 5
MATRSEHLDRSLPVLRFRGWWVVGLLCGCRANAPEERPTSERKELQAAAVQSPLVAEGQPAAGATNAQHPTQACRPLALPQGAGTVTRFVVVGDYGFAGRPERAVADWIVAQKPDFIVTTGDNNYPDGAAHTIDRNIGQYFAPFICPYRGRFGAGGDVNRFFPSLGNHDWVTAGAKPYLDYFTLPHNERYYEQRLGNIHVFIVDSDEHEPDGVDADSVQARWMAERIVASDAPFKAVAFHHPPYSTGRHGPSPEMRWPFAAWGVDLVLTGHDHHYERSMHDGVTYVVNGLGGRSLYPIDEAQGTTHTAFNRLFGAQIIQVSTDSLNSKFYAVDGTLVDDFTLARRKPARAPALPSQESPKHSAPAP